MCHCKYFMVKSHRFHLSVVFFFLCGSELIDILLKINLWLCNFPHSINRPSSGHGRICKYRVRFPYSSCLPCMDIPYVHVIVGLQLIDLLQAIVCHPPLRARSSKIHILSVMRNERRPSYMRKSLHLMFEL